MRAFLLVILVKVFKMVLEQPHQLVERIWLTKNIEWCSLTESIKKTIKTLFFLFFFFFFISCITYNLHFEKYYLNEIVIINS
jgi:hypothetical protein